MKLTVAPAAVADLARLREFLVGKNPAAADRAIAALIAAIESLDTFPERGRLSGTLNMRELIVPFGRSLTCCATRTPRQTMKLPWCESGTAARRAIDLHSP